MYNIPVSPTVYNTVEDIQRSFTKEEQIAEIVQTIEALSAQLKHLIKHQHPGERTRLRHQRECCSSSQWSTASSSEGAGAHNSAPEHCLLGQESARDLDSTPTQYLQEAPHIRAIS